MDTSDEKYRIDKWLWAARFFKTRSLASDAVENGRVLVNGMRVKPAKTITAGNRLEIHIGQQQFLVDVQALSNKRGSAPEAQKLYRESEESRERRAVMAARLKTDPPPFSFKGRPTKRDRRLIEQFKHDK